MKLIYMFLLFMIFFNIFSFMLGDLGIFSYIVEGDESTYNLSDIEERSEGDVFEDISGAGWGSVLSLDKEVWALIGVVMGGAVILAWAMHSPYPIAVGLFLATFVNVYINSKSIFSSFDVNPYITMVFGVGILVLFVITTIEYFTHGDV